TTSTTSTRRRTRSSTTSDRPAPADRKAREEPPRPARTPSGGSGVIPIGPARPERRTSEFRDLLLGIAANPGYLRGRSRPSARPRGEPGNRPIVPGREGSASGMSAAHDRPDDPYEVPIPETSKRRSREQSQLEFELDFLGRVLERDPLFGDALKVHADNLAA